MNFPGDGWKLEEENKLTLEQAQRYKHARTVLLVGRVDYEGLKEMVIDGISPNGKYVSLTNAYSLDFMVMGGGQSGWMALEEVIVHDVLVPFQPTKQKEHTKK